MGYTTDFNGILKLSKQLTVGDKKELQDFAEERHGGNMNVYDGFPGFWCQWVPTEDGWGIEWDQGEKFYEYVEWLRYIIQHLLQPKGYVLNGEINWSGEDSEDLGKIIVKDNVVTTKEGRVTYEDAQGTNGEVWTAINNALKAIGYTHLGGGDGSFGFEDDYQKGDYKVTVGIRADN